MKKRPKTKDARLKALEPATSNQHLATRLSDQKAADLKIQIA